MMKGIMKCSQFIGFAKHAPERFEESVMAVTGPTVRYSGSPYDPDQVVLQISNTCLINADAVSADRLIGFDIREPRD